MQPALTIRLACNIDLTINVPLDILIQLQQVGDHDCSDIRVSCDQIYLHNVDI